MDRKEKVSSAHSSRTTDPEEYDLVILGGGTGGTIAAWTLAGQGQRILGFTAFGVGAAEIMTSVQIAMGAGLPYTALRDTILTHPTLVEGLITLFSSAASTPKSASEDDRVGLKSRTYTAASD